MLRNALINSEDRASEPSFPTRINATLLSRFIDLLNSLFRMSIDVFLLLYVNTKGYEVAEDISKNVEVNPRMISTLKYEKYI